MALNKHFDIEILHEGTDITEYCNIKQFPAINRNLDCTQIFDKITLNISLLAGVAFSIKEQDLFFVRVEGIAHYYRVTTIEDSATDRELELSNVFELLKDKRFYVGEEGSETVNALLAGFLDLSDEFLNATFNTLLETITTLALSGELAEDTTFTNDARDYNFETEVETVIPTIGSFILFNPAFVEWGKDITPADLLKLLQLEYCFSISANTTYNTGFKTVSLPTMRISADYTVPSGAQLSMPEFFRIDTINELLNPVRQLDKDFYSERPTLITKRKKGIEIKDDAETPTDTFSFEYRNDIDTEEIEYPEKLELSLHFTPLKIQFTGSAYILKAGLYNAYHLYFSYVDIIQDPSFKLDYQVVTGYHKQDYKFTNETDEADFTDPQNARKCVFDNDKFSIILTDNRIIERNNIRG